MALPNPIYPSFWTRPQPLIEADLAELRAAPLAFHEEPEIPEGLPLDRGPGYWAVTRLDDILHVSKHPELFSSAKGITVVDFPPGFDEFTTAEVGCTLHCDCGSRMQVCDADEHASPVMHCAHATPPVPHASGWVPG